MHKWNWGAFLIGPFWGIRFRVWQAVALPLLLGVVGAAINGYYGTEWAWDKRSHKDLLAFNEVQHRWMKIGVVFVMVAVMVFMAVII